MSTSSSVSGTPTGETCSEHAGPESPSTRTYALSPEAERSGEALTPSPDAEGRMRLRPPSFGLYEEESPTLGTGRPPSICSVEDSPAKTSASPDGEPDSSTENEAASSSSSPESLRLFDPAGYSSRTYPVSSLAKAVGTSESCLERWPTSGTAWLGGFSTHVSSECRSADGECSSSEPSLTEILEPPQSVLAKYSLSARAARGILRRAEKRGRTLPAHLEEALATVAGMTETRSTGGGTRPSQGWGAADRMTTTPRQAGS